MTEKLPYRVLTGPDNRAFCERVSQALEDGYRLHGSPAVTFNGEAVVVAQALCCRGLTASCRMLVCDADNRSLG